MRFILLAVLIFLTSPLFSQSKLGEVFISNGVFIADPDIKEVADLWQNYLRSHPDSTYDNPYWNAEEKKKYSHFDLLRDYFTADLYRMTSFYKPTVLSITQKKDYYKIRTLYSAISDSVFADPVAITDVYAKKINNTYVLYNAAAINTLAWQHHKVGHITFICPQYHRFNRILATRLNNYIDTLARLLGEEPTDIDYYFADTFDEVLHAFGYDYFIGEGNARASAGHAYPENHYVIAGGSNEWYPHEFIHIYAIPEFKKADEYFQEGLATLLGGTRNHSLEWLIRHTDSLLTARSDINIDSALAGNYQFANLDYLTGSQYIFGGLICKMTMEKGGWDLLKKMMNYGPTPEEGRFKVLKDFFGIERKDSAVFLRKKISDYAANIPKNIQ